MTKSEIAFLIMQAVCLIGVVIFIRMDYKKRHPPLCDNCANLVTKGANHIYRYRCKRFGWFDHAPEICNLYDPKEGADHA